MYKKKRPRVQQIPHLRIIKKCHLIKRKIRQNHVYISSYIIKKEKGTLKGFFCAMTPSG